MDENTKNLIEKNKFRVIAAAALAVLLTGTVFYHYVEKLRWIDSFYFSVITLATIGYGDITPKTDVGKLFTVFYVLIGIGIIVSFTTELVKRAGERRQERRKNN